MALGLGARDRAVRVRGSSGSSAFAIVERAARVPMVDFSFFRSRTFLGANIVAFIVSFAMLAMFFFLALYMQNIRDYSPLQAGIRFLPSTLMIIVHRPARRAPGRPGRPAAADDVRPAGVSGSLFWQSHLTVSSGYGTLLPGFMLMGIGMGFVMSPMSTAAMNSVEPTKAGVASGILSMSRMVGGTFGVAVLGALVSTLGRVEDRPAAARAARPRRARSWPTASAPAACCTACRLRSRRQPASLRLRAAERTAARLGGGARRGDRRLDADRQPTGAGPDRRHRRRG